MLYDTNNIFVAEEITKIYQEGSQKIYALDKVSLNIKKGEFLAILGPSGAGKTTLLHTLGGFLKPTYGKVFYRDVDIYRKSDSWRCSWRIKSVGFVFQFYHLIEELTVMENIALPALSFLGKSAFKKAQSLLKYFGIEEKGQAFPYELSGGQKQKVAVARALINEPEVIFCDEPTGNLDKASGEKIVEILKILNKEKGKTIILVTHNRTLAENAERILYIDGGKIVDGEERV